MIAASGLLLVLALVLLGIGVDGPLALVWASLAAAVLAGAALLRGVLPRD